MIVQGLTFAYICAILRHLHHKMEPLESTQANGVPSPRKTSEPLWNSSKDLPSNISRHSPACSGSRRHPSSRPRPIAAERARATQQPWFRQPHPRESRNIRRRCRAQATLTARSSSMIPANTCTCPTSQRTSSTQRQPGEGLAPRSGSSRTTGPSTAFGARTGGDGCPRQDLPG